MPDIRASHPAPRQLADYGLGKLSAENMLVIENHLATCAECRQNMENETVDSFVGKLRANAPTASTVLPRHTSLPPPAGASVASASLPTGKAMPAPDEVPAELAGSSKFQILSKLGQGGMGAVWKAKHNFLGDVVAIKVMNRDVVAHPEARSRFLREMKLAGQLKHRNIVRALDAEEIGDLLVLVIEFVGGITLDRLVAQRGRLPVDLSCQCIMQAVLGLQHAHEKGMVHRDIKPANLIITPKDKEVKLLDFGLARGPREQTAKNNQTQLGAIMGTPAYMAPEQATDASSADIRADIYSLGCTLYFLLTGRSPFQKDTVLATLLAQVEEEATPVTELRADVPTGLWSVMAKMLAKKPTERYQTPKEVEQALRPFVTEGEKPPLPDGEKPRVAIAESAPQLPSEAQFRCPLPLSAGNAAEASPFALPPTGPGHVAKRKEVRAIRKTIWVVCIATGVLASILFAVIVLTLQTHQGKVTVKIDQADAELSVDGRNIEIRVSGDMEPIEIRVKEGDHWLVVKKGGFETETRKFSYRKGDKKAIEVCLVPKKAHVPAPAKNAAPPAAMAASPESTRKDDFTPLSGEKYWDRWYIQRHLFGVGTWEFGPIDLHGSYHQRWAADDPILATKRDDWRDFHVRFEVKLGGSEAIFCFRDQPPFVKGTVGYSVYKGKGYGVLLKDIRNVRGGDVAVQASGSLFVTGRDEVNKLTRKIEYNELLSAATEDKWIKGEWNTIDVTVRGNLIVIAVNGTKVVQYVDDEVRFRRGYLSFNPAPGCELFVRHIRIRELPAREFPAISRPSLIGADKTFVPLFNGKDFKGWKVYPEGTGGWKIEAGLLTGRCAQSHLFSERGDYENFHLRVEARINRMGDSGLFFRSLFAPGFPVGYEAQILSNDIMPIGFATGTLFEFDKGGKETFHVDPAEQHLMWPDQWFTQEVIADGEHIVILVNGKKAVDHKLAKGYRKKGHFALQQHNPHTVVEFRKIEIKELTR